MALIASLVTRLSLESSSFSSGLAKTRREAATSSAAITKSFNSVKAGFAGFVSGLSIGAVTQGIKASLDYAGSLGEVSQQLGVTTRELQTFRYAVSQNGGSIEQADQALGKFSISISKALAGSKQAAAAFGAVGVSLNDLRDKSKSEILGQIADRMKETGGASANAAAGVAIFGKGFQKIIPTLDQGSAGMNALAAAADELGIVLSDEQIQKADATADKLDALMTVLKAKIAGDVADNADSILDFANALFDLVKAAEDAREALVRFEQNYNLPNLLFKGDAFGKNVAGRSVTTDLSSGGSALALAKKMGLKIAGSGSGVGGNVPQFLASGGGGGKRSARAPRDTSLRDAFQFEEEQRRLDMDILRAKQDIAHDYVERTALSIEMLNLEKQSFEAGLEYQVKAKELTQAQADAKRLKFEQVDHLKRMAVLEDEEEQRKRDYNMLDDKDFDLKLEKLELEADLAETSRERRTAELKILDLAHQEQRNRLERVIRESKDWAEIEAARRELLELTQRQSLERQATVNRTRSPFDQAKADFSDLSDEMSNLKVQGIMGAADAFTALTMATDDWGKTAIDTARQVLAEFIRLQTIKFLFSMLSSAAGAPGAGAIGGGGTPMFSPTNPGVGFATGGFTGNIGRKRVAGVVHGEEFVLNASATERLGVPNLEALNRGAPIAAVGNDNGPGYTVAGGDTHIHVSAERGMKPHEARATGRQIGRGARDGLAYGVTGRRR